MKQLLLALSVSLSLTACAADNLGSARRAILDTPCAADTDCPSGFECEVEVEHGVTTSFCQAHDEDGACPAGYELEVEHGQAYCKPHGGDDDQPTTGSGAACAVDADCPAGEECELEHGAGFCKAHSEDVDPPTTGSGAACAVDADCPNGEECELEHGAGFCKPHGGN